ncbi:MAG: LamG domain-containing protein [Candidatus Paceibacterota bacterium]|jgi:hypothetical protein
MKAETIHNLQFTKISVLSAVFLVTSYLLLVICVPVSADAATKPTNNLGIVGWWPLNEGTSTIAHDISGYGNNGTLTNMESATDWVAGRKGKALTFDGVDERIDLPNMSSRITGSFTISFWTKVLSDQANERQFFSTYVNSSNEIGVSIASSNKFRFYTGASGSSNNVLDGTNDVELNRWYHVTMVFDDSTKTKSRYIDGVFEASAATTVTIGWPNTVSYISHMPAQSRQMNAVIDDFRIYSKALSPTEVAALYQAGQATRQTVSQSGLAGWWTFDEATSTIAHDFSGQNNAGTLISSPTWTSGKKGSAMQFSSLRYVTVANMPAISNTTISISAWIYPTTYSGYNVIASQRNGCGAASFQVHLDSNTGFLAFWGSNLYISTYKPPLNTWTHVNATFNAGTVTLYANGVQVGSTSGITRDSAQTLFRIGTDGTCGNPFNGKIDDVRIYSRALSDAEISDLYRQNQTEVGGSRETSVSDGLVGYWPFSGKDISWTTGRVYDRSGNNNSGIITSLGTTSAPAAGAIGQALSFDGSTSLITVPYSAVLAPTAGVSFGGWFKTTNKALAQRIVSKTETGGYTLALNEGANCTDLCALVRVGGAYHAVTAPLSSITNNKWHHVMATYDGETSVMYLDGVQTGSNATPSGAIQYATTNPLCIGREPSGTACDQFTDLFNGALDEIRVYNRALSASEVKRLYNLGK